MLRQCVATGLALTLMSTPALAQGLRGSIARAVAESAAQEPDSGGSGRIPPGLLWSGIGLLGAGGLFLGLGAAEDPENQTCVSGDDFESTCVSNRTALLTTGAVMAGVGAVLLAVGVSKRHSPQVTLRPGAVSVRQPVPVDLGIGRLLGRR
jgi:hypothetical protein